MHDDHKVYIIFFPFLILVFDSFIWNWLQYVALQELGMLINRRVNLF